MVRTPMMRQLREALRTAISENVLGQPLVDRRRFIKGAGATAVLLGTARCAHRPTHATALSAASQDPDGATVIVGGGVAGLAAAYRLSQAGFPFRLYEADTVRLGGRIFTQQAGLRVGVDGAAVASKSFNSEAMFCELGGELIDSGHVMMRQLASELGLALEDFPPGDAGLVEQVYFVDGERYTFDQLVAGLKPLVDAIVKDRLSYETNPERRLEIDRMPLGAYLNNLSDRVDRWVLKVVEIAYRGNFGLEVDELSALNLVDVIGDDLTNFSWFGESDELSRIKGGNARLIEALLGAVLGKGVIEGGHRLAGVSDDGTKLSLNFETSGGTKKVVAHRVICAIPFTQLRTVTGLTTLGLSPAKLAAIKNLSYGTNAKLMMGFKERAWRKGVDGVPRNAGGAIVVDAAGSFEFWETSRLQEGTAGILTNFLGGKEGRRKDPAAQMLARSLSALDALYGGKLSDLHDRNVAFQPWPHLANFQGSYSTARPGDYSTLFEVTGTPELDGRLLFAGEHTDPKYYGYMEGAAASGYRAAQMILELVPLAVPAKT